MSFKNELLDLVMEQALSEPADPTVGVDAGMVSILVGVDVIAGITDAAISQHPGLIEQIQKLRLNLTKRVLIALMVNFDITDMDVANIMSELTQAKKLAELKTGEINEH